jgi:hypothetical protein
MKKLLIYIIAALLTRQTSTTVLPTTTTETSTVTTTTPPMDEPETEDEEDFSGDEELTENEPEDTIEELETLGTLESSKKTLASLENYFYDLALWNDLTIALDLEYWRDTLSGKITKVKSLPPGQFHSKEYTFHKVGTPVAFAEAIQICRAMKGIIMGPRDELEQKNMMKRRVEEIWVSIAAITKSNGKYSYSNGEFIPFFLKGEDDENVQVTFNTLDIENKCTTLNLKTAVISTVDCRQPKDAFCAVESDYGEMKAKSQEQTQAVEGFLQQIRLLRKYAKDIVHAINLAWEDSAKIEECPNNITLSLIEMPQITSLEGSKSYGLIWLAEVIRENIEILHSIWRKLNRMPKTDWKKTPLGFCIPLADALKHTLQHHIQTQTHSIIYNFTSPPDNSTNSTSSSSIFDLNWRGFSLMDLILTCCTVILTILAIVNCALACRPLRRQHKKPQTGSNTETRTIQCVSTTQAGHRPMRRSASVHFGPDMILQYYPRSGSSNSSMGEAETIYHFFPPQK